ncbi:MAG: NADH-quinone oxidoreductase subunit H [Deltaproteobacteria bacterium]|nr:NADH-quinone oxidoreductase subunit H [Deltaproteobacteria bacterium]
MGNFDTMNIVYAVATIFITINYGLVLQGIIGKVYARVATRIGLRIYQPYINIIRQWVTRTSINHGIMYYLGPVFRFTGGGGILIFLPVIYGAPFFSSFSSAGDMLLIMYFMFLGTLGMALGGGESGHPYAAIAVTRGLAQTTAAEFPLILAIFSIVTQYQTLDVNQIVAAQQGSVLNWTLFTNPLATIAAMLAFLGSMMRSPFDVVLAPQEIPIGPPTEYQSQFLAMLMTNRTIFPVAKTILYVNLFFGGVALQDSWLLTFVIFFLKTFFVYMWSVFVGVSFPRFRVDQSVRWFLKAPAALGVLAIIFVQTGM